MLSEVNQDVIRQNDRAIEIARALIAGDCCTISWGGRIRLVAPISDPVRRFRNTFHAPAYKLETQAIRILSAFGAAVRPATLPRITPKPLRGFLQGAFGELAVNAVIIGTPSAHQSLVAVLSNSSGAPRATLKIAVSDKSAVSLEKEYDALRDPAVVGKAPQPLKLGDIGGQPALLTSYVWGRAPAANRRGLLSALPCLPAIPPTASRYSPDEHPWIRRLSMRIGNAADSLAPALPASLPSVRLHGDFAPWNVLIARARQAYALDWEHSEPDGLPGVDIAHYIIASARLLHRSPPARAAKLAAAALHSVTELAGPSAWAIVGLAAHFTMCREKESGNASSAQYWRAVAHRVLEVLS